MAGNASLDESVLVDSLITDVIDGLRADLHPQFGVRPYRLAIIVRTYEGEMLGEGSYEDAVTEIEPQPRVRSWDGSYAHELTSNGLDETGTIKVTEVSLTYTHADLTGGTLAANQQLLIRLSEAHGQGNPNRYFVHAVPPFVDRERDMGWVLVLRDAGTPGCGG